MHCVTAVLEVVVDSLGLCWLCPSDGLGQSLVFSSSCIAAVIDSSWLQHCFAGLGDSDAIHFSKLVPFVAASLNM